jgi:hypothetical protein
MLYEDKLLCFVSFSQILANEASALRPAPHLKKSKYQNNYSSDLVSHIPGLMKLAK